MLAVLLAGGLTASCVTVETVERPVSAAPDDLAATVPDPEAQASAADEPEPAALPTTTAAGIATVTTTLPTNTPPAPEPADPAPPGSLPGTPVDTGPTAGTDLTVVGVAHDDVLNVRDAPNGKIIAKLFNVMEGEIDPEVWVLPANVDETGGELWRLYDEVIAIIGFEEGSIGATGNARRLPTTVWYEINAGPVTGWASAAYLATLGASADIPERVPASLGDPVLADTLTELGMLVVATLHPEMSGPEYRRQVVGAPGISEGIGDVTIDVLSSDPAAIYGYRISIVAYPNPDIDWMAVPAEDAGPFTLWNAFSADICSFRC